MIYQFETESDGERFVLDTSNLKWGRASSVLAAPSVAAVENKLASFVFSEEGTLVPMGHSVEGNTTSGAVYNMDGRTPKTTGPGAGLSSVGILSIWFEDKNITYLTANVPVKEDSFKMNLPEGAEKFVLLRVMQPEPQGPQVKVAQ